MRVPILVREIFAPGWGRLLGMTDTGTTTPPDPSPAVDLSPAEVCERVALLLETDGAFRSAVAVMMTDRTPAERDRAQRAALLSIVTVEPAAVDAFRVRALELDALRQREELASASRTPGTTFAQRAPIFR